MEIFGFSIWSIIGVLAFLIVAPFIGCILAGLDRKITAGMQGRVGPRLLQPWWDFRKLLAKEDATVNGAQDLYVWLYLIFIVFSGMVFFAGGNFLLCVFIQTLGALFFILAGYSSRSPYADLGAERETVQVMSYEPMVLLVAIGMFLATGSFYVADLLSVEMPLGALSAAHLHRLPLRAHHQAAQVAVRYLDGAARAPGDCPRHRDRVLGSHACPRRALALVRDHTLPRMDGHVRHLGRGLGCRRGGHRRRACHLVLRDLD